MAAPQLNLDLSGIAIDQPRVPDPIANALSLIQTTINSLGNVHIAADAAIAISKTALGTFTDWIDFSASAALTGFSGTPTVDYYYYCRVGNVVFIHIAATGTSNAAAAGFTLPVAAANGSSNVFIPCRVTDNGTIQESAGRVRLADSSTSAAVLRTLQSSTFTASGTKAFWITFFYRV